jgi:hypothetical protein
MLGDHLSKWDTSEFTAMMTSLPSSIKSKIVEVSNWPPSAACMRTHSEELYSPHCCHATQQSILLIYTLRPSADPAAVQRLQA